ncbi:type II toxin-antitoxin system ParD family antitoxin [Actinomyces bowdenii]|uniref:Type II toxin-antitoxin system ParD family antitoxin n=1 Tax=Actinomyces bowdenii TaxID=131109 RepID=A0A3P1UNR0_9ACTO|nr:type II toxin-antitoxin system ParD family antitoxin [Actinomyces bowdenii]MBO3725757.1 type II toxin-antitoxin system ParD family antitoxin [Actinomyces bowdenii]RRD23137.1 type II toxin-antitoxin system ParD family antitoxin [Actinomyces bowdenii]
MSNELRELSIALPEEVAVALAERVVSGAYGSEGEVVRDGLIDMFAREEAAETWLHEEVGEAYDELRDHPCLAWGVQDARGHLAEAHAHHQARPRP